MKFIITIDTEEDNWANYSRNNNPVSNIERLPALQELFDQYQVKPTYLITYPVATSQTSVDIIKGLLKTNRCEIGAHCHPWNTPPFVEDLTKYNSMLCNLPAELQLKKLHTLHSAIVDNCGVTPTSFRAGRWGFSSTVATALNSLGYTVDTSISPFVNWGVYDGPDFSNYYPDPFRFNPSDLSRNPTGQMLEIPATVGYLQPNYTLCNWVYQLISSPKLRRLRLKGILDRSTLLNHVWFSPELADASAMTELAKRIAKENYSLLNFSFHSTSLAAGLSPFVADDKSLQTFLNNIREILELAQHLGWSSHTLSELTSNY